MGMKYLKLYENFNESEIHELCKRYNITNYTINSDGTIDVNDSVYLVRQKLKKLPLKFGRVSGIFSCADNYLTTLEGCPIYVGGSFHCGGNKLTSLIGCPTYVGTDFYCYNNKLTNFDGCPSIINGSLHFFVNNLTNLNGCPIIEGDCHFRKNKLTSLKGCPEEINGSFDCVGNKLTSLKGCPKRIEGDFYCAENGLISLENYPEYLAGDFNCKYNKLYKIYKLFLNKQSFFDSLDYNYFRGGNVINKIRLTQALAEFGLECPDKIEHYIWE